MFAKFVLALSVSLISSAAWAKHYVICGEQADLDYETVQNFELALYLDDRGQFKGYPGYLWELQLGSENTRWIDNDRSIEATTQRMNGLEVVSIQLNKQLPTRPVGIRYVLIDIWNEKPVLEKYEFGGPAAPVLVGEYECLRTNE